jgi:hypothetical protein
MSTQKYKIIWEKWKDPFGIDPEEDLSVYNSEGYYQENHSEEDEEDDYDQTKDIIKSSKEIRCKVILTPFGAIPYNENTASSKIFNFWTGHTNFNITKELAEIIEHAEGIETFDIFTRYRFRISVGKAFEDSVVMRSINRQVYAYLE